MTEEIQEVREILAEAANAEKPGPKFLRDALAPWLGVEPETLLQFLCGARGYTRSLREGIEIAFPDYED